jgi:hypothetical protein
MPPSRDDAETREERLAELIEEFKASETNQRTTQSRVTAEARVARERAAASRARGGSRPPGGARPQDFPLEITHRNASKASSAGR